MGKKPKRRYFYSYVSVMAELGISRRTLQRWIDDMGIEPLQFEDQLKVFLTLPNLDRLTEYKKVMRTRDQVLISRFREAVKATDEALLAKIRREI